VNGVEDVNFQRRVVISYQLSVISYHEAKREAQSARDDKTTGP
jgi:hypothetical protein